MLRRSPLLLALALLGCRASPASHVPERSRASAPSQHETAIAQPSHLLLPGGALLYAAPREDAITLRLGVAEDVSTQRSAVVVVGREGEFWKVETTDDAALSELGVEAIDGLDLYALTLYVPIGVGQSIHPIPPGPDTADDARAQAIAAASQSGVLGLLGSMASNPPLQSGQQRPAELETDFRVGPPSTVFWPDGRQAGQVRAEHAFIDAGEPRVSEVGPLRCFVVRVGPDDGGDGQLCFAEARVLATAVILEAGSPFGDAFTSDAFASDESWGNLWGDEIGEEYGVGGLGLTGTGVSAGGGYVDEGLGDIGTIGQGGGASGYGSGWGSVRLPDLTMGKLKVGGSMDADIARRIIHAHFDALRTCWTNEGSPTTTVDLSLEVDAKGKVTKPTASGSVAAIEQCVATEAKAWSFPEALAGTITLTFSFGDPP